MRICSRCGIPGDEASFFPDRPKQKWCRLCVDEQCSARHSKTRERISKIEREQATIRNVIKQVQEDGTSYVYLLEGPGGYKIGFSTDVNNRINTFNTALGETCKLIAAAPGGRELERKLHHAHRYKRLSREWFAQAPHILRHFTQLQGVMIFLPGYMTEESKVPSAALADTPV